MNFKLYIEDIFEKVEFNNANIDINAIEDYVASKDPTYNPIDEFKNMAINCNVTSCLKILKKFGFSDGKEFLNWLNSDEGYRVVRDIKLKIRLNFLRSKAASSW